MIGQQYRTYDDHFGVSVGTEQGASGYRDVVDSMEGITNQTDVMVVHHHSLGRRDKHSQIASRAT